MSDQFKDDDEKLGFMFTVVVLAALFMTIIFSLMNR